MDVLPPPPALDEKKRRLLALLLAEAGVDPLRTPILPLPRDGRGVRRSPLSFAQERLWLIDQIEPGSPAYNVPSALRLVGRLDPGLLARTLGEIVRRHETLRTTYVAGEGGPVQVVASLEPLALPRVDLAPLPAAAREAEVRRLAAAEAARPFDLGRGPLLRLRLLRLGEEEHILLATLHHIATDGWSHGVFVRELSALYAAFSRGLPSPLPELPVQYADFAAWQRQVFRGDVLARALGYWRRQLAGSPPLLALPTDRPRPPVQGLAGGSALVRLPAGLSAALKELCRREGATLFMGITAAFQVLLARLTGQSDVAVGTPVANRHRSEIAGLIGYFGNTLVLRADLGGDPTFRVLLGRVKGVAVGAFAHQELPFSKLVEEQKPERSLAHTPLFQVMCAVEVPGPPLALPGLAVLPFAAAGDVAMFDLHLTVVDPGGAEPELHAGLAYRTDLFDRTTAARILGQLATLLAGAVEDPGRRLFELPLLSAPERQALLAEWNDTAAPSVDEPLERRLAALAALVPDNPAVAWEGGALSYGELAARAARLARHLRRNGAEGPEARVGICLERSPELLIAVLAVLQAGAAYVALDPRYPAERLRFMLDDSGAACLLNPESLAVVEPAAGGSLPAPASGEDLAYILYTSGSTGRPKGVGMPRGALVNLLDWQAREALPGPARTLQFASLSFDVSFQEIASTWLAGGTLVLTSEETRRDPRALLALLAAERVERLFLPFVALRQLAEAAAAGGISGEALRDVVTAGEALQVTGPVAA
ncbi:MAG TPA: condensation domain-containing protein, partial [Thermoanaerobaculia bacterium]|nr:condensation domain-containing protein [Thermoanaerobaculia bacterium]